MLKSLVCALALAAVPVAAHAESLQVKTVDLDLSTEAGNKALDKRIMAAARKVCRSSENVTGSRLAPTGASDCVQRAVVETRQKVAAAPPQPAG